MTGIISATAQASCLSHTQIHSSTMLTAEPVQWLLVISICPHLSTDCIIQIRGAIRNSVSSSLSGSSSLPCSFRLAAGNIGMIVYRFYWHNDQILHRDCSGDNVVKLDNIAQFDTWCPDRKDSYLSNKMQCALAPWPSDFGKKMPSILYIKHELQWTVKGCASPDRRIAFFGGHFNSGAALLSICWTESLDGKFLPHLLIKTKIWPEDREHHVNTVSFVW